MKIEFWMTGKTNNDNFSGEIIRYHSKIRHYIPLKISELKPPKSKSPELIVKTESEFISGHLQKEDYVILLDEQGKHFPTKDFAIFLGKLFNSINTRILFISGGPYGFSKDLTNRADFKLSLSRMTFTHDMARLIFIEQLYRALTIIHNHPYQH